MLRVSVITVCYNAADTIESTITSVLNQNYNNIQYIIIDGNSTDGTSEYLNENLNDKILYFRENDKGIYHAINKSLKKVIGQYFLVLHAGDFFYSRNSLTLLSQFINKNKNYDFYCSNIQFYNQENMNVTRVWKLSFKNNSV